MSRAERQASLKDAYGVLYTNVSRLVREADPIGLIALGTPKDEYDVEVSTILPRLGEATSVHDVQRIVYEEFVRWFGADIAGPAEIYAAVSEEICRISMSLDGFIAGPSQSVANPLGIGGMRLHQWVFPLTVWRATHGPQGGEVTESTPAVEESLAKIGATVMGRNMFGGHPGPWDARKPWNGWWGVNPPFHHPVFVLTHYAREPLELEGGTTFMFVPTGIEAALDQAPRAADGMDVSLAGGAKAAQQYLAAGLVDEMEISVVPTLLGSGERLFHGVGDDLHGLELVRTVAAPKVTHLKFARR